MLQDEYFLLFTKYCYSNVETFFARHQQFFSKHFMILTKRLYHLSLQKRNQRTWTWFLMLQDEYLLLFTNHCYSKFQTLYPSVYNTHTSLLITL